MVGLTPDSYKYVKAYLPSNVTWFDIDNQKLLHNRDEFIQATESFIINQKADPKEKSKYKLPYESYTGKIKELESILKSITKKKSRESRDYTLYADRIRQFFFTYFLNDILEIRKCDYSQKEGYQHVEVKKKLPKWHIKFFETFCTTQVFQKFEMKIRKCTTPEAERLDRLIQNFRKDPKKKDKPEDLREIINLDVNLKKLGYQQLADIYYDSYTSCEGKNRFTYYSLA